MNLQARARKTSSETFSTPSPNCAASLTDNYNFVLAGYENTPAGGQYVLSLLSKTRNKFLYRGKIWFDAHDFAVVRIEGEPAKNHLFGSGRPK